jgi:IS30 family transposase
MELGRCPSTFSREIRRRRSRPNSHFYAGDRALVDELVEADWSTEHVSADLLHLQT